jgi:hypothetical protein
MGGKCPLCLGGGRYRLARSSEGDEEAIALGVHLAPAMRRTGCPQQPVVGVAQCGIAGRAQLLEQVGGTLEVGEQEGDGAGGERGKRGGILDGSWQRGGGRDWGKLPRTASSRHFEGGALLAGQEQGLSQERDGVFARGVAGASLQIIDASHAQAGSLGQFGLGQPCCLANVA